MTERHHSRAHPRVDTDKLLAQVDIVKVIEGYVTLRKAGAEFEACCPFHEERTPSFKVNPVKQIYHCFGCGANGDAIKFLRDHQGMDFLSACRALGADIPDDPDRPVTMTPPAPLKREPLKEHKPRTVWVPVHPVPADAPPPPAAHSRRGLPETVWTYRAADGQVLGFVYRFRKSDGGKETLPLCWARAPQLRPEWHWLSFAEPRPLYGLDRLAAKPGATVLVVEGEKCADAAAAELPDLAVVSWPGGGKAVGKVDWSPLAGRKVITWADCDAKHVLLTKAEKDALPDDAARAAAQAAKPLLAEADQPGVKAMAAVHQRLHALDARVWTVKLPAPGEKPDGWDVADAVADGLTGEALAAWVRERTVRVPAPGAVDEIDPSLLDSEGISTPSGACASPPDHDDDWGESLWRGQLLRRDGKLLDCRENVYLMLRYHPEWRGVLWADEFARRIVVRQATPLDRRGVTLPRVWEDTDNLRLGLWLAQRERMTVRAAENIAVSVGWAAAESPWNPVLEYLEGLVWDKQPRTRDWLTDYLGVERTAYTSLAGHLFLIGMVARVYRPGCQMRFMPIFEGSQYRGKSSALRILGGDWFGDTPLDLNNKDSYQLIQGCWIYEVAELDAFNRAEATRIKAFVSSQVDRFRAPYERAPRDWPRQGVFFGTTNQDEYFKDSTGNTRYWPLRVEQVEPINLQGLTQARDQLFAEAVALFKAGERWHPTGEEQQRLFEPEQAAREIGDPWQPIITRYLRSLTKDKVTVDEILTDCLKIEIGKIDRAKQQSTSVGIAMKRIGWHKKRDTKGDREYYYERPDGWNVQLAQPDSGAEEGGYVSF